MLVSVDQRPERERGTVFSTVMRIFNVFTERAVAEFGVVESLRRGGVPSSSRHPVPLHAEADPGAGGKSLRRDSHDGGDVSVCTIGTRRERRERASLGLFLDELANVVPIEDLPALASQGAGRGVMLMSIVQDLSQFRARYGVDRANTILNNHGCKVILPGISDPETADVLGKMIGRMDFTEQQVSLSADGRVSRSYSIRHDAMATPDALRQLSAGSAIVIHRDSPPAFVNLPYWFQKARYRRLAKVPYFRAADHVPR